ncbi:MAG: SPFH domain-containing protein, partial [Candidatus Thorarchaeota archaeon]
SRIARRTTALGPVCVATAVNKMEQWDVEVIDENNLGKFGPRSDTVGTDHEFLQRQRPADIVGLYGDLKLKIRDVSLFYNDVVAGKGPWTRQQLKEFINGLLFTSLRDIFKKYTAKQVMLEERDRIINLITGKVVEEFLRYGLELETLDILGVKTPGGNETLFNVEKVKFKLSEDAEIYKLNLELANSGKRIAELKEKLDTLDELLVNDKISKDLYKTRVQRIEKELKELEQRSK